MRLLIATPVGMKPSFHYLSRPWQVVALVAILVSAQVVCAQKAAPKSTAPVAETNDLQYEEVKKAMVAFKRGDSKAARELLVAARAKYTELAPADVMLAILYYASGKKAEGQAALENATINDPKDPEAYVLLGDLALRSGQRAYADLAYQRAQGLIKGSDGSPRRLKKLKVRIEAGLASLSESRGQYDDAQQHLLAWKALVPTSPVPVGSLGRVLFHLKKYDEAREAFAELVKIEKDSPPVDIAMGRLYSDAGMQDEALACMTAAVKQGSKDIRIRLSVSEWALQNGHMQLAQECIEAALKMDKSSVSGQVLAARMARQLGEVEKAESILQAAVLSSPNQFAITNEFARTLAMSSDEDKWKTGLKYAEQNFRLYKNQATGTGLEAAVTYAWLLARNGQSTKAEAALHTLPDKSSISSENAYYAARIYLENNKPDLAANALRATLSSEVAFPGKEQARKLLAELTAKAAKP
jgi:predicted Zn-dependent protease